MTRTLEYNTCTIQYDTRTMNYDTRTMKYDTRAREFDTRTLEYDTRTLEYDTEETTETDLQPTTCEDRFRYGTQPVGRQIQLSYRPSKQQASRRCRWHRERRQELVDCSWNDRKYKR